MKRENKILKLVAIRDGEKYYLCEYRGGRFSIDECTIEEWPGPGPSELD